MPTYTFSTDNPQQAAAILTILSGAPAAGVAPGAPAAGFTAPPAPPPVAGAPVPPPASPPASPPAPPAAPPAGPVGDALAAMSDYAARMGTAKARRISQRSGAASIQAATPEQLAWLTQVYKSMCEPEAVGA